MIIDRSPAPAPPQVPAARKNNLWYRESGSAAALVFVHGVLSDSRGCWLNVDDEERPVYWPELITTDSRLEGLDIFLGGYYTAVDSGPYEVRHCADELGRALRRPDVHGRRPVMERDTLIFVAHSTGGIVVRYLLESEQQDFAGKRIGLLLIASPSYGSRDADRLAWLVDFFRHQVGAQLRWGSWTLKDLDHRFKNLIDDRRLPGLVGVEAYEHHFVLHSRWFGGVRKQVVTEESAGRYFGAPVLLAGTNHFTAVKPRDPDHPAHLLLVDFVAEKELLPAPRAVLLGTRGTRSRGAGTLGEEVELPFGVGQPGQLRDPAAELLGDIPGSFSFELDGEQAGLGADLEAAVAGETERRGVEPERGEVAPLRLPEDHVPEPGPLPPGSRMPLALGENFVGRKAAFRALARALNAGASAAIGQVQTAAATGLGGLGKTRLASQFVYRYGRCFPGGVFWLSFAEPEGVAAEVALCGGPDGMDLAPGFAELPLEEQVQRVLAEWRQDAPRLLVFDNCEDPALLDAWTPRRGGARVLVTSRRERWPPGLAVEALPLAELPREESVALLRAFRPDLDPQDSTLEEIAGELGGLPLALELAGSYLRAYRHDPPGEPAAYLAALRQGSLLDHPSLQGYARDRSLTGHERHVARTFALSYDQLDPIRATDALARALFLRACLFAPGEPIPRWLLLATLEGEKTWNDDLLQADALARLGELGLLRTDETGALVVHRLLAAFGERQEGAEEALVAVEEAVDREAGERNEKRLPQLILPWQSQLRYVTERAAEQETERGASLCSHLEFHLHFAGEVSQALPFAERALAIREAKLGREHPDTKRVRDHLEALRQELPGEEPASAPAQPEGE